MARYSNKIAMALLGLMFVLMFFSARNDSLTMDELAHIPAGYSYLTQKDYRLNPEHPPLIKDLAALPLLFLNLNFPTNIPAWQTEVNGQWEMGSAFLYQSDNKPDKIIDWARLAIMLLAILLGWLLFRWSRGLYGDKVGLLTLFFFALSPTFLAHSHYVTTDLGATFGFFIGLAFFVKFLKKQTKKNLFLTGLVFGLAQLFKFSLVLLAPIYLVLGILWVFLNPNHSYGKDLLKIISKIIIIGLIGLAVIWLVYQFHTINYPPERQLRDTEFILSSFSIRPLANLVIFMAGNPILRPLGQYFLGVVMVIQRSAGGNTAYFLGNVSNSGWWHYFPVLYFLKEPLAFYILAILALIYAVSNTIKTKEKKFKVLTEWLRDNFALTSGIIFIIIYWTQSIISPLNIGLRHVMPTFPFIYLLVSREIIRWLTVNNFLMPKNISKLFRPIYALGKFIKVAPRYVILGFLMLWLFASTLFSFPYYLSYYNELVGSDNGYKIAVDSNYDWGQDLKRLEKFVEKNNIGKIKIDYFGGGSPNYYFGEKFEPWQSKDGVPEPNTWLAVSATFLQSSTGQPIRGFEIKPEDSYSWLEGKEPVARAGTSIFIYKF